MSACASWAELAQFAVLASGVKRHPTNTALHIATLASNPWLAQGHAQPVAESEVEVGARHAGFRLNFPDDGRFKETPRSWATTRAEVNPVVARELAQQGGPVQVFQLVGPHPLLFGAWLEQTRNPVGRCKLAPPKPAKVFFSNANTVPHGSAVLRKS